MENLQEFLNKEVFKGTASQDFLLQFFIKKPFLVPLEAPLKDYFIFANFRG